MKKLKINLKLQLVILLLIGCGSYMTKAVSPAFDIRLKPNDRKAISEIYTKISALYKQTSTSFVPNSLSKPVLLGTKAGRERVLFLYLIDEGRMLWSRKERVSSKPTLLYDTVIVKSENILKGIELSSGKDKWSIRTEGWDYFGASQQGSRIFITFGIGGECRKMGRHRGKVVALNSDTGSVIWKREAEGHCLGVPATFGGYVFVPFDMQSISIIRASDGVEVARLLSLDDNFTFAASFPEGVFYGSKGLYFFDENSFAGLARSRYELTIKKNDPILLTFQGDRDIEITLYRSKGGAPPGFEDKATPFGKWERGQDRFLAISTDCKFRITDKKGELTTLQEKGNIFVGGEGSCKIEGNRIVFNSMNSTYYSFPVGDLPGEPELFPDRISPVIGLTNARDKIRLFWYPEAVDSHNRKIKFVGNSIFLVYYRFIFSFDSTTGQLKWARRNSYDIEDVTVSRGGVFLVDRKGDIICFDIDTGEVKGKIPTGVMLASASFGIGGYKPDFPPIKTEKRSLRESLLEMVLDRDNRLVPIRKFALEYLSKIQQPEVTRDLLAVYMNKAVPEEVKDVARQKLLQRKTGASYLVEAMKFHYDYLDEVSAPPMGVVAQALVNMKAKEGVPGLIAHLIDHETPLEDLKEVSSALLLLGDESIVPTISDYLIKYHADSAFLKDMDTLYVLSEIVYKFGGDSGRELLKKLQVEDRTLKALSNYIKEIFNREYEKTLAEKLKEKEKKLQEDEGKSKVEQKGKVYQTLPQEVISKVLSGYKAEFAPCIKDYLKKVPETSQIRMKFILNNKGRIENLMTLPNDPALASCLMGVLVRVDFPPIRQLKQTAQYLIRIERKVKKKSQWPPAPAPVQPSHPSPPPSAQAQQPPQPAQWLPVPQPQPLPQPAKPPQPPPPAGQEEKPKLPQPGQQPSPPPSLPSPPAGEEYPEVLPEDLPQQ